MASKDEACSVWTGLVLCLVMCDYLSLDYCMATLLSSSDIWVSEWYNYVTMISIQSRQQQLVLHIQFIHVLHL